MVRMEEMNKAATILWGFAAVLASSFIFAGGPSRWDNKAHSVANLVPGSPYTWAVFLFTSGLMILLGSFFRNLQLEVAGLYVMAFWCSAYGLTTLVASIKVHGAPLSTSLWIIFIAMQLVVIVKSKATQVSLLRYSKKYLDKEEA